MLLIEHSDFNEGTIGKNFGAAHYSYWFVRSAFRPVIERLGKRIEVADPRREVDEIYHAARARGQECVYLSFNPPQKTVLGLSCPMLPIFAWEYDTIPNETWNDNPQENWAYVLGEAGAAAPLSSHSAAAVRKALGDDFPVWALPSPLFDTYAARQIEAHAWRAPFDLRLDGAVVVSAGELDLSRFYPGMPVADGVRALRVLEHETKKNNAPPKLNLEGVVYTTVACPADGRKNWRQLVSGFVHAFRNTPTATLIFKLTHANLEDGLAPVLRHISVLGRFSCKIYLVNGMLSDAAYADLIAATTYVVNTSFAEGQCLPLTEYMSAGRPAVAPRHSAMLDYVAPDNSFVIRHEERPTCWPQDERHIVSARDGHIVFLDLVKQFRDSYAVAREDAPRYARMSAAAIRSMRNYCSNDVVAARMKEALNYLVSAKAVARKVGLRAVP